MNDPYAAFQPPPRLDAVEKEIIASVLNAKESSANGDALDRELAEKLRNDMGNGERIVARYGAELLFVQDVGWHWYDGLRWSVAQGSVKSRQLAHRAARALYDEAVAIYKAGPREGESRDDFIERVKAYRKFAAGSGNSSRLTAMLCEAAPYVNILPSELDVDPFLFNLANGTLRLQPEDNGGIQLKHHEPDDRISRVSPVVYDPNADCPLFRTFLDRILPDAKIQMFLQQWFGYSLTADASEQRLVVMWGDGANGKSTLNEVVSYVMGDYAMGLPFASLTADDRRRGDAASPDLARLPGARAVRSAEGKQGVRLDESIIKAMTGGEPMVVRHLHQGFFEFQPVFKLTLSTNHKPVIRGTDAGIWRRVVLVPFDVKIPDPERDKSLASKLKAEASGILNWLLDGLRLWFERGLVLPDAVVAATAEYRSDSDPISGFLLAATEAAAKPVGESAHDLYSAYRAYCEANAVEPVTPNRFGRLLQEHGYEKRKGHTVTYSGLALKADYLPLAIRSRRDKKDEAR